MAHVQWISTHFRPYMCLPRTTWKSRPEAGHLSIVAYQQRKTHHNCLRNITQHEDYHLACVLLTRHSIIVIGIHSHHDYKSRGLTQEVIPPSPPWHYAVSKIFIGILGINEKDAAYDTVLKQLAFCLICPRHTQHMLLRTALWCLVAALWLS